MTQCRVCETEADIVADRLFLLRAELREIEDILIDINDEGGMRARLEDRSRAIMAEIHQLENDSHRNRASEKRDGR